MDDGNQVEGPRTASELLAILHRVVDEQGSVLVASRVEEEERQLNRRLREEQDVAYQAALRADQVPFPLELPVPAIRS
jgi:FAS-associated factor 2